MVRERSMKHREFDTSSLTVPMTPFSVATRRGVLLKGVLFSAQNNSHYDADVVAPRTVVICLTGIHGNLETNPMYYHIGETLGAHGFDFVYAQMCDAYNRLETENVLTGETEWIGSFNEDFYDVDDDIEAYLNWARESDYKHVILAGHSIAANKVLWYLSRHPECTIDRFIALSPVNITIMMRNVTDEHRQIVDEYMSSGRDEEMLPFEMMGWAPMIARTGQQWLSFTPLDNCHIEADADYSVLERVEHRGAFFIGGLDSFADGNAEHFIQNNNAHLVHGEDSELVVIPRTGHTYQHKGAALAQAMLEVLEKWINK